MTTRLARLRPALAAAVACAPLLAIAAVPTHAYGHGADPRVSTVLADVSPPLPAEVVLQVQAGIATQLVASNPTPTVLEVLGSDERAFLRISSAGVFADLETREFFTTSNPTGAVPPAAGGGGPPRWVQISTGTSWGWYDHRLHPQTIAAPADPGRAAPLGDFTVPVRYGDATSLVRGSVLFSPLLGAFQVSADPAPNGLVVQALPGRLPGVFLSNPERLPLTVFGRDGEPFLRFGALGLEVNEHSRTHVEDRQARGMPAGPPLPEPAFRVVDQAGSSYTWLDARLRYPAELPPDPVLRAADATVVDRWSVPVQLGADRITLTGTVSWVPAEAPSADAGRAPADGPTGRWRLLAVGLGALVLLGALVVVRRRARASAQAPA